MNEHDVPILETPARLSAETVPLFARVTRAYEAQDLLLDLSKTAAITSAGLGHLVALGRRLSEQGAVLALAGGNRRIRRLLEQIGLDRLIPHFRTVEDARGWIRARDRADRGE